MIRDVDTQELIMKAAKELERMPELRPPGWTGFVKTGADKERTPTQENWWWIRAASILRRIYLNPRMGVSRLRKDYGGRKNRGHKPEHKYKGSGSVVRKVLQQLEAAGFVVKDRNKGRKITQKGASFLSGSAKGKGEK